MKNKINKIALIVSFIGAIIGVITKLQGYKIIGDIFLLISTVFWVYIFYRFIIWFITERKSVDNT